MKNLSLSILLIFSLLQLYSQNAGDILKKFPAPNKYCTGLTYDGKYLWTVDRRADSIYALNLNGKIIKSMPAPGYFCMGMTYDGKYLWISDKDFITTNYEIYSGKIYKINPKTGKILKILFTPGDSPMDLAWDGKYLWIADASDKKIYCLDTADATIITSFPSPWVSPTGMTWDGKYLWIADNTSNKIYRVDPSTGRVIMIINAPGEYPWGMTWLNNTLISTDYQNDSIYFQNIFTDKPYRRMHKIKEKIDFTSDIINYGPGTLNILNQYIAIPKSLPNQDIEKIKFNPQPNDIAKDKWGQKIAIFSTKNVPPNTRVIKTMTVYASIYEVYYNIYPEQVGTKKDIPKQIKEKYLQDEDKYKINSPIIQSAVKEAIGNEQNLYWIARDIFDYVREKLHYERSGGWDIAPTVLRRGSGSCSEYSFVYIAMCRAAGIPARFAGSVVMRAERSNYDYVFHRWVEIYLPPYGWIPVDPSGGDRKYPAAQAEFFGHLYPHYLITTQGAGNSEFLGWDYNSSIKINANNKVSLRTETIADWDIQ